MNNLGTVLHCVIQRKKLVYVYICFQKKTFKMLLTNLDHLMEQKLNSSTKVKKVFTFF